MSNSGQPLLTTTWLNGGTPYVYDAVNARCSGITIQERPSLFLPLLTLQSGMAVSSPPSEELFVEPH